MGKYDKPHGEGIERKKRRNANLVNEGFDWELEEQCRALKAEDELRPYWVDRALGERAAAREAHAAREAADRAARRVPAAAAAPPAPAAREAADRAARGASAAAAAPPAPAPAEAPPAHDPAPAAEEGEALPAAPAQEEI